MFISSDLHPLSQDDGVSSRPTSRALPWITNILFCTAPVAYANGIADGTEH